MGSARSVRKSTSQDVAALAGVSRPAVSQILNGRGDRFPPATRQRVLQAASELDYRPSRAARNLARGRDDTVVLLVPPTTFGPNLQDAADEVGARTAEHGLTVLLMFGHETREATVDALLRLGPWAVIDLGHLDPATRADLERGGVAVHPRSGSTARNGQASIIRLQVEALLRGGPRDLVHVSLTDRRADPYGPHRRAALRQECAARGLAEPREIAVPTDLTGAVGAIASLPDVPLGFACYNDETALAVLAAARELEIDVPRDAAVVGVDALTLGQLWSPPLTTVRFDIRRLMAAAVEELLGAPPAAAADAAAQAAAAASAPWVTLIPGGTT